jgi:biopolymer transport protein ExbD
MERHHQRAKRAVGFNLVSLMDIFTILVFFLLVNSSDVQDLAKPKSLTLPESIAEAKPRETVVVMVTGRDVFVQGDVVATIDEALAVQGRVIQPLKVALEDQASRRFITPLPEGTGPEVTIMGDKEIPFKLLKKIMTSCTEAGYQTISLAVMQRSANPDQG